MNTEKLNQQLFAPNARVYAVLDGASVPNLPMKLFEMNPPRYCLFAGELKPDMAEVAPYLVRLYPKTPFAEWVLKECWGQHWGIFARSRKSLNDMRAHFRSLTTVYDEKGDPMTFRFYDPRVLQSFLPTCKPAELKVFFGDVDTFFAESEDDKLLSFNLAEENNLKQSAIDVQ
ncbi:MAG TPA: DUF4123 domain-containing protein [Pyrinomonadaceae bacterium]